MVFYYQTECKIGDRGPRICRRYTGIEALVAITLELALRLTFDLVILLVGLAVRLCLLVLKAAMLIARKSWRTAVAAMTVVVYAVTLPFVLLNRAVDWHRPRIVTHAPTYTSADPCQARLGPFRRFVVSESCAPGRGPARPGPRTARPPVRSVGSV